VGVSADDVEAALIGAPASRGASPVAILTHDPARPRPPRSEVATVRGCVEASSPWKGLGVAGIVLPAEAECAREALAAAPPPHLRFAAGCEPSGLALPPGSLLASAGAFSISRAPEIFRGWLGVHAAPPSFEAALGRDAAVLAWAAVQALPARGTEDPAEVEAR